MVRGTGTRVANRAEKTEALRAVVEHMVPGRWDEVREPDGDELDGTQVIALDLEEASAKARAGPPIDKRDDVDPEKWAGLLPLEMSAAEPIPGEDVLPDLPIPPHVASWRGRQ